LDDERIDVVVPTPVLTELLASARVDVAATLAVLRGLARVRIEGFGERAAIECAEMLRRTRRGTGPKAKIRFDQQIVAIAKVIGAATVYSDDGDVKALCERESTDPKSVRDLPARPWTRSASWTCEHAARGALMTWYAYVRLGELVLNAGSVAAAVLSAWYWVAATRVPLPNITAGTNCDGTGAFPEALDK
jgi:hypothetical protein